MRKDLSLFAISLINLFSLSRNIEFKENDISVLYFIFLPHLSIQPLRSHSLLSLQSIQVIILHDFGTDESPFEIGMNYSGCLGSFVSLPDSPTFDFILSTSEVMGQL